MGDVWSFLAGCLVGAVAFLPVAGSLLYFLILSQNEVSPEQLQKPINGPDSGSEGTPEKEDTALADGVVQAAQWVYLTQHFVNVNDGGEVESMAPPLTRNETAVSSLKKLVNTGNTPAQPTGSPVPKSLSKLPKYWAVVKQGHLELYADRTQPRPSMNIKLVNYIVTLWPPGAQDFELFYKKFAICLVSRQGTGGVVSLDINPRSPPKKAYFIYLDNGFDKEDMYFALIKEGKTPDPDKSLGPRDPTSMAQPIEATEKEKRDLLSRIYSVHESPQTQWLNALLGRLFLAVKDSKQIEDYYRAKIVYKLSRAKPGFIGDIEVTDIFCGSSIPFFTDIKLKDLDYRGALTIDAGLSYHGGFAVKLATSVHIAIPGLKARTISIVLAVKLRSLDGRLVVKVKPPPSSRIWYAFEQMPKMDLEIEPVVSSRQFNFSLVTKGIGSAIRESLKESMVMPYMDDITFFNTSDEFYRGGIWDWRDRPSNVPWHAYDSQERSDEDLEPGVPVRPGGESKTESRPVFPPTHVPSQIKKIPVPSTAPASVYSSTLPETTTGTAQNAKWSKWSTLLRRRRPGPNELRSETASTHSVASDVSARSCPSAENLVDGIHNDTNEPPRQASLSTTATSNVNASAVHSRSSSRASTSTIESPVLEPVLTPARSPVSHSAANTQLTNNVATAAKDEETSTTIRGTGSVRGNETDSAKFLNSPPFALHSTPVNSVSGDAVNPASIDGGGNRSEGGISDHIALGAPLSLGAQPDNSLKPNGSRRSLEEISRKRTVARKPVGTHFDLSRSTESSPERALLGSSARENTQTSPVHAQSVPPLVPPRRRKLVTLQNVDPEPSLGEE